MTIGVPGDEILSTLKAGGSQALALAADLGWFFDEQEGASQEEQAESMGVSIAQFYRIKALVRKILEEN